MAVSGRLLTYERWVRVKRFMPERRRAPHGVRLPFLLRHWAFYWESTRSLCSADPLRFRFAEETMLFSLSCVF